MKYTIEIEIPNGKKAIWKDGKILFEDIKLPKSWEEFCALNPHKNGEYYISAFSRVCKIEGDEFRDYDIDKNVFTSEEIARQHIALMQLHRLRDYYRQGWVPDWENYNSNKYCIISNNKNYTINLYNTLCKFLAFQSEEIAEEFLNNFEDLIKQAGDLI